MTVGVCFGSGYGESHGNQWGLCGAVVQNCVVIELPFVVVSGVRGHRHWCIRWGRHATREWAVFGGESWEILSSIGLNGVF